MAADAAAIKLAPGGKRPSKLTPRPCFGVLVTPTQLMRPTEDEEDSMPPPFTVVKNAALITFSGEGTLFRLAEPVGMHYREVLFKHTGLRLPRPDVFTRAYQEVYDEKVLSSPCFGCGEALSSRDWWWSVVWDTYMEVRGGVVRE